VKLRDEKRFPFSQVRDFARKVFRHCGINELGALEAANVLCAADEWGIRSHGVARLRSYCEMLLEKRINPAAQPYVASDRLSLALVDGDNGLGLLVGLFANKIAMEKAKKTGIGWVHVINSNHFGIAGYYVMQGVEDNLIGIAMTNTPPLVTPFGGEDRKLGTNPIAAAFPAYEEAPVVIDLATSAISLGTVQNAAREGENIPAWCVVDSTGKLSTDPQALIRGGALLPLGGARETGGHKGYCLASMVDLFCGVFPGASWGPHVPPFLNQSSVAGETVGRGIGHVFGAISIDAFEDPLIVRQRVDKWVRTMRSTRVSAWAEEVLVPGDPERRAAKKSKEEGVMLEASVVEDLRSLARELRLEFM
jgi:L-2-hydroxycarboxylate dehydrogenase (NAD+)